MTKRGPVMTEAAAQLGLLDEPAPAVDPPWVGALLLERYGLSATVRELASERDRNFLARVTDGRMLIVKVSNSAEDRSAIDMENAAMQHVERVDRTLDIPRLVLTPDGQPTLLTRAEDGREHVMRIVTGLSGHSTTAPLGPHFAAQLGGSCARLATALQGFFHPAAGRQLDWDPRRVETLRPHLAQLTDPRRRALVIDLLDRLDDLPSRTACLPSWPQHADVTLSNVLVDDAGELTGLIDFGDMHHTARVCDLAISLASLLRVAENPWSASADFLSGYQRRAPLEPAEAAVIGDLVLARLVATVLISAWRARVHTDNLEYVTGLDAGSWRMLDLITHVGAPRFGRRLERMCGTSRIVAGADPTLAGRRQKVLGGRLSPLFYREPLHIVRGEGPWLFAADGRRYLDAYNNVPVVGHAHPCVVRAISGQTATLNVNSRYLHANIVELAERLIATMPAGLDTAIFVNSGSEANDLAWRLAVEYTGHTGAVVTDWAYHGVSQATAALSSNTWVEGNEPGHVAVFEPPYDPTDDGAARVGAAVADLAERGRELALLAVDTMFTSPGVRPAGRQYMAGLVDATHAGGGLFLADEVQAGYGRSGALWRFSDAAITPDFVTLGKPMGNGHPIAAVITRRDIVDRFSAADEYFSTFGGNPVSCAAALAVLDVIEESDLPARAAAVGQYLRAEVRRLAERHDQIGAVRGVGLMAGVDIQPGELSAADIAEGLRANGVLISTTGRHADVLKVRPPLVWDISHVDVFVGALEAVLSD
jgi:4-aminobutyrate aminotransferase-like enzyme/Ser/Thr protein kinase RdoA (MazF antagonist)